MCNAKNNHHVMRKQSQGASGASAGYTQEGGGRNSPGWLCHQTFWVKKKKLKNHNWNRQRDLFSSAEYDFKGQFSLYFRLLDFKGSNISFIFSWGLVLNHMLIVKYPRIGFTNPNLTPELLVFKAFPNARERVGAHTGALILLLPFHSPVSLFKKGRKKAKGKEREKSQRETQKPFPSWASFRTLISSL